MSDSNKIITASIPAVFEATVVAAPGGAGSGEGAADP